MKRKTRWATGIAIGLLATAALAAAAAPPLFSEEVTDYGRSRWRTHYTPSEPEYPLDRNARPVWEVPLGLSRSQPLVIQRDFDGNGAAETRVYHVAGDRLWALNADMTPAARGPNQSVESYRQQLAGDGFILWSTPADALCSSPDLLAKDELLALKCLKLGSRKEVRPFASSQAAYWKGVRPTDDVIYVGFGHPASLVAIRAYDGKILGGYIIDARGDRGIVGAPLVFGGDIVVIGTTNGEAIIVRGIASGVATQRTLPVGGRISFSPVPLGESSFIIASDARTAPGLGTHGYMMSYGLGTDGRREFAPSWPAAVVTAAGIPGEAAVDAETVFMADKFGRLYALRHDSGELLWCRQYPGMQACTDDGGAQPSFINNGPGVDEDKVYFVYRNDRGPNQGGGYLVAMGKATGQVAWQHDMGDFKGNTAPVPMGHVILVGDTGGYVRAYDKWTGEEVTYGGYPLKLSDEPYREGDQGEQWWEPIGGTATQMTVASGLMLVGVNSNSEERTVLKAYRLYRLPDLTLRNLAVPESASATGFTAQVRAVCTGCPETLTTSVSLRVNGIERPRQPVTFRSDNGWTATLSWPSGPLPEGADIEVIATIDPDNAITESDETNNSLRATVFIPVDLDGQNGDRWGSKLTD
ncbi:MAG TPA: PQQ-binding-like beta-propeller repeat protein [Symbiobacteriaceae bacterium]|nr:PQQ-binding-like beta-propeller repeat protein [Symbiobacteriaceae bacterium]